MDETAFLSAEEKIKNIAGFRSIGMRGLLEAVRSTGAKNVVLAGGSDSGYDLSGIAKRFAPEDKTGNGITYASHVYPWKSGCAEKMVPVVDKYPVLCGENGANVKRMMGGCPSSQ